MKEKMPSLVDKNSNFSKNAEKEEESNDNRSSHSIDSGILKKDEDTKKELPLCLPKKKPQNLRLKWNLSKPKVPLSLRKKFYGQFN